MKYFFVSIRKFFLLGLLIIVFFTFFYFRLYQFLTLETLKTYQVVVQQWTTTHYKSAVSLYILSFIILVACAIPCATFFSLIGGFLFGSFALLYAEFSTVCGGLLLFLAIRTALGHRIAARTSGWVKKMEQGFQDNAFNYLISLRLIPIFPCWISNIAAGMLNVPLRTFLIATSLGILPATAIYVMAGQSLDTILADTNVPLYSIITNSNVLFPLLGLATLSVLPVFYRIFKK